MKRIFCLLAALVLLFSGCAANAPAAEVEKSEPQTVKMAVLKGPTALGMLPLIDSPTLSDGTTLEIEILPAPDVLVGRLATGELDFATVPTNLAAKLYNKNQNYRLIAMNTWGSMYILGVDPTVNTLEALKGKTLYSTGKGTTPDILLHYLLKKSGIDAEADLTIDATLPPTELAQLAAAGKVDQALLPEPFVTLVMGKNPNMKIVMDMKGLYQEALGKSEADIAQTCLVVRNELLQQQPELVEAVVDAYAASLSSVTEDPKQAGVLAEKHQIIQSAVLAEKAVPRCGIRFLSAADAQKDVNAFLEILMENAPEDIGGKLPDEGFYVLEY